MTTGATTGRRGDADLSPRAARGIRAVGATYLPAAYEEDGFIHTTRTPALIPEVANRYYRDDPQPYLLLTIDLDRVAVPWRYDAAGDDYPHIYGSLDRGAIVALHSVPRAADGTFLPLPPLE